MRLLGGGLTALLVVSLALLSGCVEAPEGCVPPVSATEVPQTAPSEDGVAGQNITIEVLDAATGLPMHGASVVTHWNRHYLDADESIESTPALAVLGLATDAHGKALAHIPEDRFHMTTAWSANHTEEASRLYWPPADESSWDDLFSGSAPTDAHDAQFNITLYPARWNATFHGTFPGGDVGSVHALGSSQSFEFKLATRQADGISRIGRLEVELEWPIQGLLPPELELSVREGAETREGAKGQSSAGGMETRTLRLDRHQLHGHEADELPGTLTFHVRLPAASVLQSDLDFTMRVNATLEGRSYFAKTCGVLFEDAVIERTGTALAGRLDNRDGPGFAFATGSAVLVALAWLARRRGDAGQE